MLGSADRNWKKDTKVVVGITFAIYPLVRKLSEEPDEVKPEKYTLFGDSR